MKYSEMSEEQLDACAELLGHLSGTLTRVCDVRELGPEYMLALDFAYSRAKHAISDELKSFAKQIGDR